MGTKTNPGEHDCLAKALPDEPVFVLLARDPTAPALVRAWADRNEALQPAVKVGEALLCADQMAAWRTDFNLARVADAKLSPAEVAERKGHHILDLTGPAPTGLDPEMHDLLTCTELELVVGEQGQVWLNLDGRCILRVAQPQGFSIVKRSHHPLPIRT